MKTIIGVGVGSGLTAQGAVKGGADLLACYSTACYRVKGLPSSLAFLPYDNANQMVEQVLPEVVLAAGNVPVFAGVGAHDPRIKLDYLIEKWRALGVSGLTNEPFVGIYQGDLRHQLEAAGIGYQRELELAEKSIAAGLDFLGWAWDADEAKQMADLGVPYVGCMLGITAGGQLGSNASLGEDAGNDFLAQMVQTVNQANPDCLTLIHGGHLHGEETVLKALTHTGANGYLAGSAGERIPAIEGIKNAVSQYVKLERK